MDYQRFIELLERFFGRAGTLLHKKGEHYSDREGNPAFIILDEDRNTYYLTEIAIPPDYPSLDRPLQDAVDGYARRNGMDSYLTGLFSILGESVKSSNLRPVDDAALESSGLNKRSALVVADSLVDKVGGMAESMGLSPQVVPLKGIFTIYFFNREASDILEKFYNTVSGGDDAFSAVTEEAGTAALSSSEVTEDVPQEMNAVNDMINTAGEMLDSLGEETLAGTEPEASVSETYLEEGLPEASVTDPISEGADYPPPRRVIPGEEPAQESSLAEYLEEREAEEKNRLTVALLAKNIVSFLLYAPAYIIGVLTRGKIPGAIAYWIGSVCVLLGLYYFPLVKGLQGVCEKISHQAAAALGSMLIAFNRMPRADGEQSMVLEQFSGFTDILTGATAVLFSFDNTLLYFLNSSYYLQYLLAFAYLLAVVPLWRTFGRRMICFMLAAYVIYMPLLAIGSWVMGLIGSQASQVAVRAASGGSEAVQAVTHISAVAGSMFVVAAMIPFLTVLFGVKLCKGIWNDL